MENTGDWNTGNCNTGDWNTGNCNTGDCNTGEYNTGDWNTGDWNTGNRNTGYFNRDTPETIRVFEKETPLSVWEQSVKPSFIYFDLLENKTYKESFTESFNSLSEEHRIKQTEQLKNLPNFDKEIFKDISGIDIDKYEKKEMTVKEIEEELGHSIKIVK